MRMISASSRGGRSGLGRTPRRLWASRMRAAKFLASSTLIDSRVSFRSVNRPKACSTAMCATSERCLRGLWPFSMYSSHSARRSSMAASEQLSKESEVTRLTRWPRV